jgi:hypothetical protein
MRDIGETTDGLPEGADLVAGPRVQREVGKRLAVEHILGTHVVGYLDGK